MPTPTLIAGYVLLFAIVGSLFLTANLLLGWLVRPHLPSPEKEEIYECGEPTIGSSFVQFDLRFYVVALLFIIFDVEVAFFFPWATVFGKSVQMTADSMPRTAQEAQEPTLPPAALSPVAVQKLRELGISHPTTPTITEAEADLLQIRGSEPLRTAAAMRRTAERLAWSSLFDIGVFFGVLMVGFAYVWKRGDLDWVRSVSSQKSTVPKRTKKRRATAAVSAG